MDNYPRDPEWYIKRHAAFGSPLKFDPAPVSFIEIWNYPNGQAQVLEGTVESAEIKTWLRKEPHTLLEDKKVLAPTSGLRLLIHKRDSEVAWKTYFPWIKEDLIAIMSEFRLPSSFLNIARNRMGSFYSMLSREELMGKGSELDLGFILLSPIDGIIELNLVFSWNATTKIAGGIIRTVSQEMLDAFLLELKSLRHFTSQPLVFGLATLEAALPRLIRWLDSIHKDIATVQRRTGHLGGIAIDAADLQTPLDYDKVSLEVSRISQMVGWYRVIWKSYLHLCDFMAQSITRTEVLETRNVPESPTNSRASMRHAEIFSELLTANKNQVIHHLEMLDYYKELCVIQNQNVYNLIAQRDVQQNIELARDSKSIAVASKRDSSAMKSIALLTMIVLPGTFISTLFAIPLFNWDAESWRDVPKSRFWFYWALTIPLTILTVGAWLAWQKVYERTGRNLDLAARETVSNSKIPDDQALAASSSSSEQDRDEHDILDGLRMRKRHMLRKLLPQHKKHARDPETHQSESAA